VPVILAPLLLLLRLKILATAIHLPVVRRIGKYTGIALQSVSMHLRVPGNSGGRGSLHVLRASIHPISGRVVLVKRCLPHNISVGIISLLV
jgi:hypothetical protein